MENYVNIWLFWALGNYKNVEAFYIINYAVSKL